MKVLYGSVMEFKKVADEGELVLRALRRNGHLAYIPKDGKFQKLTEELCPWISKMELGPLGSHRYPKSWLDERYSWTIGGVPQKPDWSECMTKAEKQDHEMEKEVAEKNLKSEEDKYQDFIMRKLGKLSHSTSEDQFIVDHEVSCCGQMVKVPVFEMDIDGQSNLITPQLLEILQQTPAERRAKASQPGKLQHWKAHKIVAKHCKRGRGNRLKLALKPFSPDLIKQLDQELRTKTRREVFSKLKFITGGKNTGKAVKFAAKKAKVKTKKFATKSFMAKFVAKAKGITANAEEKFVAKAKAKAKANDKEIRTTTKLNCWILYSIYYIH
jgi:hypothetical protein